MVSLLNAIINATTISALYAVVAIGFTLIFGVGGVLNFAHGALITVGAFGGYVVSNQQALSPWLGFLAGGVAGAAVGAILYLGIVRYVEDEPVVLLILTFVSGFFIQHTLRIFIANRTITIPQLFTGQTVLLGNGVQNIRLFIFLVSWMLIGGVFAFINNTRTGKAIIATSMSDKGSAIVGIRAGRINLYTWVLASGFAGLAGVLLAMLNTGSWSMGAEPLVLSFSIVILGGLGSVRGSVVGAYVIGFTETFTTQFISTKLTGFASLVLLIVFLLIKPEGLFGREAVE